MEKYESLVEKCDSFNQKWLPLWVHSLDTYHVMNYLLNHWMSKGGYHPFVRHFSENQTRKLAAAQLVK